MGATLIEWGLKILAYICLGPFLLALACADRIKPKKKMDGSRCALPEASPQEAERPYIPPAIVVHRSMSDRIGDRATPEEIEDFRNACLKMERARVAKWN